MKQNYLNYLQITSTILNKKPPKYNLSVTKNRLSNSNKNAFLEYTDNSTFYFKKSEIILAQMMDQGYGSRFLEVILVVIFITILCFYCVKSSIDWATNSQTELNKMKDAQLRSISDQINDRFKYIRKTE